MKRDYRNRAGDAFYESLWERPETLPFFFTYDGKPYRGLPGVTARERSEVEPNGKQTSRLTGRIGDQLEITLVLTHYFDHGATEWTLWFRNVSDTNTGLLENLRTEIVFEGDRPVLKGIYGDNVNQYQPYEAELSDNIVRFSSDIGRATHLRFPYFNLEYGDGGAMLAIGWAGTWRAGFEPTGTGVTYTASAVNGLRTYLKPGEHLRTALFVVAPYTVRNEHYATNYWRDWFISCNLPRADASGRPMMPFSTCCIAGDTGLPNSDGSISERYFTWKPTLEKMLAENVKVDFRWFDAGWYVRPDGGSEETDWWGTVGTWELDPVKWPGKTFLESTDYAREHGMKTLMWFEPERVTDPENLAKNFGYDPAWAIRMPGEDAISNNIGDPGCFRWTSDRIRRTLRENKVEMYREDNNCNPAELWRFLDGREGDGRCGITECKLIEGHYALWDEIIEETKSYGGCAFVDSCASGGGRNDLESMRRGVPLLRSDSDRTGTGLRLSMTTAFNRWIPFCGALTREKTEELTTVGVSDPYVWRASYLPALNVDSQFVYSPDQNFDILRFGLSEWSRLKPYLLKEFYLLTPWHNPRDVFDFTAYSFFDPETQRGVLLAFRQDFCLTDTLRVFLPFTEGRAFTLTDEDTGETVTVTDRAELTFRESRTARLLWIVPKE